jgi:hypothetical protein
MAVTVDGDLQPGVTAKDVILAILGRIGTGGGIGHMIEYRGSAIRALSMEGRMTVCNMSIEAGAKAGLIAPDETTFEYLQGRPHARRGRLGRRGRRLEDAVTDDDATFDKEVVLDAAEITAARHLGHQPRPGRPDHSVVPDPDDFDNPTERNAAERALEYMGLEPGTPMKRWRSTPCSSARAPTAASRTCGPRPRWPKGRTVAVGHPRDGRARLVHGEGPGRGRGPRQGLHRRRLRLARAGLLDVPGHEPRQARPRRALRPAPATATSRAARAAAAAPTSCRPAVAAATAIAGTSPPPTWRSDVMKAVRIHHRHRGPPRPLRRRHRPDHPVRLAQAVERTGFEKGLFSSGATTATSCSTTSSTPGQHPRRRPGNFGTGSSREHAVWAIQQYGFDAVISPRFGDIFRNNCTKNGLVPVWKPSGPRSRPTPTPRSSSTWSSSSSRSRSTVPHGPPDPASVPQRPRRVVPHADAIDTYEANRPAWLS